MGRPDFTIPLEHRVGHPYFASLLRAAPIFRKVLVLKITEIAQIRPQKTYIGCFKRKRYVHLFTQILLILGGGTTNPWRWSTEILPIIGGVGHPDYILFFYFFSIKSICTFTSITSSSFCTNHTILSSDNIAIY